MGISNATIGVLFKNLHNSKLNVLQYVLGHSKTAGGVLRPCQGQERNKRNMRTYAETKMTGMNMRSWAQNGDLVWPRTRLRARSIPADEMHEITLPFLVQKYQN